MTTLIQKLEAMPLKEFRIFQKELEKLGERKVSMHMRNIWKKYYMLAPTINLEYAANPEQVDKTVSGYLERCDFGNQSFLSEQVTLEDPSTDYSIEYGKIWFSSRDTLGGYTLRGSPEKYDIDLPTDFSGSFREPIKEIPVDKDLLYLALIHWVCYRKYIDSKPDDDRPFDSDEEEDRETIKNLVAKNKQLEEEKAALLVPKEKEELVTETRNVETQVLKELVSQEEEIKSIGKKYKAKTTDFAAELRQVVNDLKESKISPTEHDARVREIRERIMQSYEEFRSVSSKFMDN